jgi:hypothetical protein
MSDVHDNQEDSPPDRDFFRDYDLDGAWEELKTEFREGTTKTKAKSTAKLFGKSLWNAGLYVAKNAPALLEKEKTRLEKEAGDRDNKKILFEQKSNAELIDIVKNGSDDTDRKIAYAILKSRKAERDAMNAE